MVHEYFKNKLIVITESIGLVSIIITISGSRKESPLEKYGSLGFIVKNDL